MYFLVDTQDCHRTPMVPIALGLNRCQFIAHHSTQHKHKYSNVVINQYKYIIRFILFFGRFSRAIARIIIYYYYVFFHVHVWPPKLKVELSFEIKSLCTPFTYKNKRPINQITYWLCFIFGICEWVYMVQCTEWNVRCKRLEFWIIVICLHQN